MSVFNDLESLQFAGAIRSWVESEYGALLLGDEATPFCRSLWEEYVRAGKPKRPKTWLNDVLPSHFQCIDQKPDWIERVRPRWPFFDDRPMVFIGRLTVPNTAASQQLAAPGAVLYLFGVRRSLPELPPDSWEMAYTVVEQVPGL
jgi:hypothetical protein